MKSTRGGLPDSMTVWKLKFWLMYVASKESEVVVFMDAVSAVAFFSAGLLGLGGTGSSGGSAAFSLTVTVSNGPPSRLSKKSESPSLKMTMSHG